MNKSIPKKRTPVHKLNCKCFVCTKVPWNKGLSKKDMPQNMGFKIGHKSFSGTEFTRFKKGQKSWNKDMKMPDSYGKNHPFYKGDKVGYTGLHNWVRNKLGSPSRCEFCGTLKAKKFEWCNKDHKYKRNLNDWLRLCTSCHRKYDYEKF